MSRDVFKDFIIIMLLELPVNDAAVVFKIPAVKEYHCRSLTRPALTRSSLPSMDLSSLRRRRDWSQDARCLVLPFALLIITYDH